MREKLTKLDFNFAARDRFEQEYLRARFDLTTDDVETGPIVTPENKERALEALIKGLLATLKEQN